jgi:hypothetical protein
MTERTNSHQEDQKLEGQITIMADYFSLANEIIQPDQYVSTSRYFCLKWEPSLGLVGARIIRVLRSLGYYNRQTGEMRDGIPIDLPELATLCGFSVATIKREFGSGKDGKPANPFLHTFVQREKNYKHDAVTGQIWREENIYRVKMDDPVHPDDFPRLQELWENRQKGGKKSNGKPTKQDNNESAKAPVHSPFSRKAQNDPYGDIPRKAHIEPNGNHRRAHPDSNLSQLESNLSQVAPESIHLDSNSVQNEPTLIDYSYLPKIPFNSSSDVPEFSLSLFSGEEVPDAEQAKTAPVSDTIPVLLLWGELTPEEQKPYRDQAKAELHKYAVEAGAACWTRIGPRQEEVRAKNLFARRDAVSNAE